MLTSWGRGTPDAFLEEIVGQLSLTVQLTGTNSVVVGAEREYQGSLSDPASAAF